MKKVRAVDDIVFENEEVPMLPKGAVYAVGGMMNGGIVLQAENGEVYLIDAATFEEGFEIAEL